MSLDSIINVQITRGTRTVSRAGFGVPMILGQHTRFAGRIEYYTSFAGVTAAGFISSDAEYKAAQAAFAQDIKPARIAIGRRTAAVAQVITWTPVVANLTLYTVTINGTLHSYTSDASATDLEIVAALLALINGGAQAAKVTASGTTTLIVTADAAGEPFTYANSTSMGTASVTFANNGVQEDIDAVIFESDDWYCLHLTSRTDLDITLAAAKIQSLKKIFVACSDTAAIKTSSTTDLGSVLKDNTYTRTALLWSGNQISYPEVGWAAPLLALDPGSETWNAKTINGSTADNLTASEIAFLQTKYVNYFTLEGGVNIVQKGQVSGNEWIDIIRGIDWLEARIKETIFARLVSVPKIPYTDPGVAIIEGLLQSVLLNGVRAGLIAGSVDDPQFETSAPKVADVDVAERAARNLPDVTFNATLAGAIHTVQISGIVSV